jgi:hypothetical protein
LLPVVVVQAARTGVGWWAGWREVTALPGDAELALRLSVWLKEGGLTAVVRADRAVEQGGYRARGEQSCSDAWPDVVDPVEWATACVEGGGEPAAVTEAPQRPREGCAGTRKSRCGGSSMDLEPDLLLTLAVALREVPDIHVGTGVLPIQIEHPMAMAQRALTVTPAADSPSCSD